MPPSDVEHAREMLALEQRAKRRLSATSRLTLNALGRSHTKDVMRSALSTQMANAVFDVRTAVRREAAAQFERVTGLDTAPSNTNDRLAARRAGSAFARSWYKGGAGHSGGGGSTDDWDSAAANDAAAVSIARIAAYEVASAWNDEHRRNADAHPEFRFIERWCAILDTHLCKRCRKMNGTVAGVHGFSEGWPPLHPDCRCIVITTFA